MELKGYQPDRPSPPSRASNHFTTKLTTFEKEFSSEQARLPASVAHAFIRCVSLKCQFPTGIVRFVFRVATASVLSSCVKSRGIWWYSSLVSSDFRSFT